MFALISGSITVPATAARAEKLSHATLLQKGLSFYKGKTITFYSSTPGGTDDTWIRLMAPYMATYLHATIEVNSSVGNDTQAQNLVASSSGNGLTIGHMNPTGDLVDIVTGVPGLTFKPGHQKVIGAPGAGDCDLFIATKASGLASWSSLVANTSPIPELALAAGYTLSLQLLANLAFNAKIKIITGYTNEAALVAGFDRGDGDFTLSPVVAAGPLIAGGRATPLAMTYAPPKQSVYYSALAHVPTLAKLVKKYPPKTAAERAAAAALPGFALLGSLAIFAPAATPADRVTALRTAMKWAMSRPSLVALALREGLTPGFRTWSALLAAYNKLVPTTKHLAYAFKNF